MKLLDLIVSAHSGNALNNLSSQFNVSEADISVIARTIIPVLSEGFSQNSLTKEGLTELLRALGTNRYQRYYLDAKIFSNAHVKYDGIAILNHAIPSSDVRHKLQVEIMEKTSLRPQVIEEILPLIASLAMGALDQVLRVQLRALLRVVQHATMADDQMQNPFRATVDLLDGLESKKDCERPGERAASSHSKQNLTDRLSSILFWPPAKNAPAAQM